MDNNLPDRSVIRTLHSPSRYWINQPNEPDPVNKITPYSEIRHLQSFVDECSKPLSPIFSHGVEIARTEINRLQRIAGIRETTKEEISIALLSPQDYSYVNNGFNFQDDSIGLHISHIKQVLIKDIPFPTYYLLGIAFHEFIHKYIDSKVMVEDQNVEASAQISEHRRTGLAILSKARNLPVIEERKRRRIGLFMNELGVYAYESNFINNSLLSDPIYFEENEQRNFHLKNYLTSIFNNGASGKCILSLAVDPIQPEYNLYFNYMNMFFDNEGKLKIDTTLVYTQIATELEQIWSMQNKIQNSFADTMLLAKAFPEKQVLIRRGLEAALGLNEGKSLFNKMKFGTSTDPADLLSFLYDLQQRYSYT